MASEESSVWGRISRFKKHPRDSALEHCWRRCSTATTERGPPRALDGKEAFSGSAPSVGRKAERSKKGTTIQRNLLVSCPRNSMYFVAIKMGRRQGGPSRTGGGSGAYLNRYVTDEQRSRRPIFIATLWAGAGWLFFCVARSARMIQIGALRSRLEKQPTASRQNRCHFGDRTLCRSAAAVFILLAAAAWARIVPANFRAFPSRRRYNELQLFTVALDLFVGDSIESFSARQRASRSAGWLRAVRP